MFSIIACEDAPAESARLKSVVEEVARKLDLQVSLEIFSCGEHLLMNFVRGEVDLALIDVVLGDGIDGMQTARRLRELDEDLPIVFVTSSTEYAVEGYDVQALHYLVKPVSVEQMQSVFSRCASLVERHRRTVELTSNRTTEHILVRDIIYAEVWGNRTTVHTRDRSWSTYTPLSQILEQANDTLLRCHRSFMVNMDHVARVQKHEFIMDTGDCIPIRTNGAAAVVARYQEYLARGL